eukprot:1160943-Pelagomonas_calceolata.AAC.1
MQCECRGLCAAPTTTSCCNESTVITEWMPLLLTTAMLGTTRTPRGDHHNAFATSSETGLFKWRPCPVSTITDLHSEKTWISRSIRLVLANTRQRDP